MTRWQLLALLGSAFLLGAVAVQIAPQIPSAVAQDPAPTERTAEPEIEPQASTEPAEPDTTAADAPAAEPTDATPATSGGRLVCRLFLVDVRRSEEVDTSDRTTEVGQWVGTQVDAGLQLYGVDFEVGQKPTGYPQGYINVCMYPS